MTDENVQKRNIAFMLEHPNVWAAFEEIAAEYAGQEIGFHVITQDTVADYERECGVPSPLPVNTTAVRHMGPQQQAIAFISPNGEVHRLDRED